MSRGRILEVVLTMLGAVLLLIAAAGKHPYGFYMVLRLVITVGAVYWAWRVYKAGQRAWTWMFAAVALLLNPFLPIRMQRAQWQQIDLYLGILLIGWSGYWLFRKAGRLKKNNQPESGVNDDTHQGVRPMVDDDYSLDCLIQRARAASPTGEVSPATRKRLETLSRELEEVNKKLEEHQEKQAWKEAQRAVDRIKEEVAREERKAGRKRTQAELDAEFDGLVKDLDKLLAGRKSPEEEELAQKREELELLQNQLAERELFLANVRAELAAFEGRYLREVGVLYAELDDWNARVAESVAEQKGTEEARAAATEARSQAEESHAAAHGEAAEPGEFSPSPELKSLYREAAKLVHPDLATDDADRQRRELLMKEANRAYQEGDADALRRIIEEYESSPESVKGAGVGADLVRVIRQIKQVRVRLAQIELEIASLTDSEIAKLKAKAEEASKQGRDLLAEMAENVKRRVEAARRRYESRSMSPTP